MLGKRSDEAISDFKISLKARNDGGDKKQQLIDKLLSDQNLKKVDLPIDWIDEGENVRSVLNRNSVDMDALVKSIEEVGLLQPIVIRPIGTTIDLISGHRRLAAWKRLFEEKHENKYQFITAIVHHIEDDKRTLAQLVENANRENLSAIDLSEAYLEVQLSGRYKIKELAEIFGKSPDYVGRNLKIARWPSEVKEYCRSNPSLGIKSLHIVAMKKMDQTDSAALLEMLKKINDKTQKKPSDPTKREPVKELEGIETWLTENKIEKTYKIKFKRVLETYYQLPLDSRKKLLEMISSFS